MLIVRAIRLKHGAPDCGRQLQQQFFRMKNGFFAHSPFAAQFLHVGLLSLHSEGGGSKGGSLSSGSAGGIGGGGNGGESAKNSDAEEGSLSSGCEGGGGGGEGDRSPKSSEP